MLKYSNIIWMGWVKGVERTLSLFKHIHSVSSGERFSFQGGGWHVNRSILAFDLYYLFLSSTMVSKGFYAPCFLATFPHFPCFLSIWSLNYTSCIEWTIIEAWPVKTILKWSFTSEMIGRVTFCLLIFADGVMLCLYFLGVKWSGSEILKGVFTKMLNY